MTNNNGFQTQTVANNQEVKDMWNGMLRVANIDAVYSEPIQAGKATVIQAAEVMASGGFGFGEGASSDEGENAETSSPTGEGRGGGGGGYFLGRPVATIIIEDDKVRVEPVVDATKIALAFFTMIGSFVFMVLRMKAAAQKKSEPF